MVYQINNAGCGYKGKRVLEIGELTIDSGALTFIIGASGVGKSTLLETLGLMNNTLIANNNSEYIFKSKSNEEHNLKNIWEESNAFISRVRDNYFSFIFQQTNLMGHFSVEENMIISQLINGVDYEKAKEIVLNTMNKIHLDQDILDRNISELSGGQRQRLAFVRAFTANFEVLLGDEPTGNLDPATARSLMSLLKEHLSQERKSGIVVSHDIHLAIEFADKIIPIEKRKMGIDDKEIYGYIDNSLIWKNNYDGTWETANKKVSSDELYDLLLSYLLTENILNPG